MMSEPETIEVKPVMAVSATFTGPYEQTGRVMDDLIAWLLQTGYPYSGSPFAIYYDDPAKVEEDKLRARVCLPVAEELGSYGNYERSEIEGGTFASILHEGTYKDIPKVYEKLFDWIKENGYEYVEEKGTREVFRKILGEVDSAEELMTEVMVPVKEKE